MMKKYHRTFQANTVDESAFIATGAVVIGEGVTVGRRAIVLNGARIGRHCLVGAGALVAQRKAFPDQSLIIGAPARLMRPVTDDEIAMMRRTAAEYVEKARAFKGRAR